jgi:hypothetical protein
MPPKEVVERLIRNCQIVERGVGEISRGVDEFKLSVEKQPTFVRPLVKRDFESGTGMNTEEWKKFLEQLAKRFKQIENDAKQLMAAHNKEGRKAETSVALTKLNDTATPFLNAASVAIESINNLATYLGSLPDKINIIPKQFLSEDERKALLQSMPEYEEKAKTLAQLLAAAKEQLSHLLTS